MLSRTAAPDAANPYSRILRYSVFAEMPSDGRGLSLMPVRVVQHRRRCGGAPASASDTAAQPACRREPHVRGTAAAGRSRESAAPRASSTARSITLRSSRTLPGHGYLERVERVDRESTARCVVRRSTRRNCLARSGMSTTRSRSGGSAMLDGVDAVAAGRRGTSPSRDALRKVAVRRRDHAHVRLAPSACRPRDRTLCWSSARSSLPCASRIELADLVEEQRAAGRQLHQAELLRSAPAIAPLSWPNSSTLELSVGQRSHTRTSTNGPVARDDMRWMQPRDELLARARLAR